MCMTALVGASLAGGVASASAASKAAKAQSKAAGDANETQRYIFDRSVELTDPQRRRGDTAGNVLASWAGIGPNMYFGDDGRQLQSTRLGDGSYGVNVLTGHGDDGEIWKPLSKSFVDAGARDKYLSNYQAGFEADPGYRFRLEQGQKAINNNAAARGLRLSSDTQKALGDYSQGMASQEYGNAWNRLAGLAGAGQTATNQQIQAGQNYAGAYGQNALAAGNARASGYMNTANAFNNTMGDITGLMMMNKWGML